MTQPQPLSTTSPDVNAEPLTLESVVKRYGSLGSAVKANDVAAMKVLAEKMTDGISPEIANHLLWAGSPTITPPMADCLVELGANPRYINFDKDHRTGIRVVAKAIKGGNQGLVEWLLEKGHTTPTEVDNSGRSILATALMVGDMAIADMLLAKGADINAGELLTNITVFHHAAGEYMMEPLLWLIKHGADPTIENHEGARPEEMIPEKHVLGPMWNPDEVFGFLCEYRVAYTEANGQLKDYPVPDALIAELNMEKYGPDGPPAETVAPAEDASATKPRAKP